MISYANTAPTVMATPVVIPGNQQQDPYKLGPETVKGVMGLSITQIVMGVLCIIFEIVLVVRAENSFNAYLAPGIWNGVFLVITGVIGVLAAAKNLRGLIIAYMILNIILCLAMVEFSSLTGIAVGFSTSCYYYCSGTSPEMVLNIMILTMALSQFIMTIVAASLCCGPACCNSSGRVHTVVYHNGMQQQQQMATHTVMVGNQPHTSYSYSQGQQPMGGYSVQQPPNYYGQPQQSPAYYDQAPQYQAQQNQDYNPPQGQPANGSDPQNPQQPEKMRY